jgi:murein DD-endopeptidase MepM/ murein hydrolase activator NlpD
MVVFAGDDSHVLLGPSFDFYGNAVVIQLDRQPEGRAVYLLQGHLSKIAVRVGEHVRAGVLIGEVGATGVAIGSHLHFEVRTGSDNYSSVRNPELWLLPRTVAGTPGGALAGRVVDRAGRLLPGRTVALRTAAEPDSAPFLRFLTTYDLEPGTAGSDDLLQENFAATDLEPGEYQVIAYSPNLEQVTVVVHPGKLSWVDFGAGPDPIPACSQ